MLSARTARQRSFVNQLFEELKRRNVFRVAIAYLAVAWLIIQVADVVFDNIGAPAWLMLSLMFFLAIGFPIAVLFAWAYEMTPEGLKREEDVDRSTSITRETGQKLNRTIIAVLAVAVVFLLIDKMLLRDEIPESSVTDRSVAVLPFVPMSSGEDDEYFADGLTEEILNSLTRVPELLVTARTSAFYFKGKDLPVPVIAESLGVAHIVEGSVRRDGGQLRVTAQLIRAEDGFHLWSENYDQSTSEELRVQTDIAEKIAAALDVILDGEKLDQMQASGMRSPEAFIAYQRGQELYGRAHGIAEGLSGLGEANEWFDRALALSPGSSTLWLLHADYFTHVLRGDISADISREDAYINLVHDLDMAIQTAADRSEQLSASYDKALITGDWQGVQSLFDEFSRIAKCANTGWINSNSLGYGKASQVLDISLRIAECDPLNHFGWWDAVQAKIWLGDFAGAIELAETGHAKTQHQSLVTGNTVAHIGLGDFDGAEDVVNRLATDSAFKARLRLHVLLGRGDREEAERMFNEMQDGQLTRADLALRVAARLGDFDSANRLARKLDETPYGYLSLMTVPAQCYCGAPWDLDETPNFKKMLEDAELPWPPASPINWPLKDW
jgi:TolB-like protein